MLCYHRDDTARQLPSGTGRTKGLDEPTALGEQLGSAVTSEGPTRSTCQMMFAVILLTCDFHLQSL